MIVDSYRKQLVFFLIILFISIFGFFSCTDSVPRVQNVSCSMVYDFSDENSKPDSYLSVFASPECNVARIRSIKLVHEDTGLEWKCENPEKISGKSKKSWAGYSRFLPVAGESFPTGRYTFYFEDMAGNEEMGIFFINYPAGLSEATASEFPLVLKVPNTLKITLYNDEDVVIYYGDMKKEWKESMSFIHETYPKAVGYRYIYYANNGSILCLMPYKALD